MGVGESVYVYVCGGWGAYVSTYSCQDKQQ